MRLSNTKHIPHNVLVLVLGVLVGSAWLACGKEQISGSFRELRRPPEYLRWESIQSYCGDCGPVRRGSNPKDADFRVEVFAHLVQIQLSGLQRPMCIESITENTRGVYFEVDVEAARVCGKDCNSKDVRFSGILARGDYENLEVPAGWSFVTLGMNRPVTLGGVEGIEVSCSVGRYTSPAQFWAVRDERSQQIVYVLPDGFF